jgi:hypothetical protein
LGPRPGRRVGFALPRRRDPRLNGCLSFRCCFLNALGAGALLSPCELAPVNLQRAPSAAGEASELVRSLTRSPAPIRWTALDFSTRASTLGASTWLAGEAGELVSVRSRSRNAPRFAPRVTAAGARVMQAANAAQPGGWRAALPPAENLATPPPV